LNGEYVDVVASDGVRLRVRARGPDGAPAILFIHGYLQSHLAWRKQFEGALAERFHLIALDLRGHGWSDKPSDAQAYRGSRIWGDDVAAVFDRFGLERAVLVGWSYGGQVILDYVRHHGAAAVAGINFVGAVIGDGADFYGADAGTLRGTRDGDPMACIDGTRTFLHACFARQPTADDFERMLAYNMMVPPSIRTAFRRPVDAHGILATLEVPVLFTQGSLDGIIAPAASAYGAATVPNARLALYEGIGHSPFLEDAERFDRDLADFVRTCHG